MRAETFFVKYISVHNCFLHFSERWLEKFKDTNNLVSFSDEHSVVLSSELDVNLHPLSEVVCESVIQR